MKNDERIMLTPPDMFDEEVEALIEPVSQRAVYPARYLFSKPGEDMGYIFYLKSGRTRHYMQSVEGATKLLYTLSPGWFFGETALSLGVSTGLFSSTETECVLYKIPGEVCRRLLGESERFRDHMIRGYSYKLLMLRYEIENLTFNSCKGRLMRLFAATANPEGTTDPGWLCLRVNYSQSELGEIVGGSRVTVSRALNDLCEEGFMRVLNRHIEISACAREKYLSSFE